MDGAAAIAAGNPRIKRLRRLIGRRSSRLDDGVAVVEGPHAVEAALGAGVEIAELFVGEDASADLRALAERAGGATVVRAGVLDQVLSTRTPQPIAAVVPWRPVTVGTLAAAAAAPGAGPLVVLHEVQDPGNLGTALRSAAAFGACGLVVTAGSTDPSAPKCVRASAGALFQVPVAVGDPLDAVLEALRAVAVPVVAAAVTHTGVAPDAVELAGPVALLLGNEGRGLPADVVDAVSTVVTIPVATGVESLNLAMAATVLLFESERQRRLR